MRESTVRGPAVDLSEFERRLRGPERKSAPEEANDPLSELARLMQGEEAIAADPYSRILNDPRAPHAAEPAPGLRGSYEAAPPVAPAPRHFDEHGLDQHAYVAPYVEPHAEPPQFAETDYPEAQAAYHGAEGGWNDDAQYLDYGQSSENYDADPSQRGWFRPWHAVAAISLLAIGSIGWGFAHRSGVGGTKEIATINAPEGPVKVKPTAEADSGAPDTGGAAVLDRKENEPVKQVVTNQEQAVEPTVVPKTVTLGNGPVAAPHEPAPAMPPPKKVKTVTVRPDGTRVDDAAALPPAVSKATRPAAAEPPAGKTATPAAAPAKTTTPKVAAKPKPLKPPHKVAAVAPEPDSAPPAPAEPADAGAEPATAPVAKGGYAVQFGAAASETEAKAMVKTVSGKYGASLGGHKPSFHMATVAGKTVYRVRVAGVSKDSASAICGKVKASGGNCFIAGN